MAGGVDRLERDGRLAGYQYLPAVRADLLRRAGRDQEAEQAYREALAATSSEAERAFLAEQLPIITNDGRPWSAFS